MAPFALVIVAVLALYFMTPEERLRLFRRVSALLRRVIGIAVMCWPRTDDPFYAYLRARIRWPLITYVLVAACVVVFVSMLFGSGGLGDPATQVAWGANFGPRTTGGERWRVFTSIFVHRNVVHLLVTVTALVQIGLVVERVVGPFTFGTICLAAGVLASIMTAAASPMSVTVGAAGAVFGAYGLLFAATFRGILRQSAFRIPLSLLTTLAPVAALFVMFSLATGESIAVRVGLYTGVIGGFALTRSVQDYRTRLRRFAALGAATAAIVLMSAMALRAVTDVRPTIATVVVNEERIAATYDAAVLRFKNGRINTRTLAQVIDQAIVPDLQRARDRVSSLVDVPVGDAPLIADTREYLRLREEGWRVRADALRKGSMRSLMEADKIEQASLLVFARVRPSVSR